MWPDPWPRSSVVWSELISCECHSLVANPAVNCSSPDSFWWQRTFLSSVEFVQTEEEEAMLGERQILAPNRRPELPGEISKHEKHGGLIAHKHRHQLVISTKLIYQPREKGCSVWCLESILLLCLCLACIHLAYITWLYFLAVEIWLSYQTPRAQLTEVEQITLKQREKLCVTVHYCRRLQPITARQCGQDSKCQGIVQ